MNGIAEVRKFHANKKKKTLDRDMLDYMKS